MRGNDRIIIVSLLRQYSSGLQYNIIYKHIVKDYKLKYYLYNVEICKRYKTKQRKKNKNKTQQNKIK